MTSEDGNDKVWKEQDFNLDFGSRWGDQEGGVGFKLFRFQSRNPFQSVENLLRNVVIIRVGGPSPGVSPTEDETLVLYSCSLSPFLRKERREGGLTKVKCFDLKYHEVSQKGGFHLNSSFLLHDDVSTLKGTRTMSRIQVSHSLLWSKVWTPTDHKGPFSVTKSTLGKITEKVSRRKGNLQWVY